MLHHTREQNRETGIRAPRRALRIVLADDDPDTVNMLGLILRDEGHVVHAVYAGNDVLPLVRTTRPDAVVLDINVPKMSGYAVAQEIRYLFTAAWRPLLVAISGVWKEHADKRIAGQVGFDAHLLKPCDPAELLELLEPLASA